MSGEIDNIVMNLFSLKERLFKLEGKIELYSSQQILVSLLTSISVIVAAKLYEYMFFSEQDRDEYAEIEEYETQFEESDTDTESDTDIDIDTDEKNNLHSGCGSNSSGLE